MLIKFSMNDKAQPQLKDSLARTAALGIMVLGLNIWQSQDVTAETQTCANQPSISTYSTDHKLEKCISK